MSAVISECGLYRYRLDRVALGGLSDSGHIYAFIGVNPSTADAVANDATIRKLRTFVQNWGGARFIVGNAFAFRSTDVRALRDVGDPIGPENDKYLMQIVQEADYVVPMWGARGKLPKELRPQLDNVAALLRLHIQPGKVLWTFGLTGSGDPMHPLMIRNSTQLQKWN